MSGSIFAYSQLMAELWRDGEPFLVWEHDIEPDAVALREALTCPCEWGVSPYRGPSATDWEHAAVLKSSLGFTRFSAEIIKALPDAVEQANQINDGGSVCPPGDWKRLDCRLYSILRGAGDEMRTPHFHTEVKHHHFFANYGCSCGGECGR